MLGAPQYTACRSPRTSETLRSRKWVVATAVCICVAVTVLNCSLMPVLRWRESEAHVPVDSLYGANSGLLEALDGIAALAGGTTQHAANSTSSSSSSSSSSPSATGPASTRLQRAQNNVRLVQSAIRVGIQALNAAGINLTAVQQMQIDRIRMQAELYAKGRLQQRRAELEAELRTVAAAAAARTRPQGTSSSSSNQQPYSRGILIVTGSRHHMANALVSIIILRHVLNCTLPIELVYYGQKEHDKMMIEILNEYSISEGPDFARLAIIDGSQKQRDLRYHYESWGSANGTAAGVGVRESITGFAAKVHALAYVTSFQQVLLLDADNLPLINPAELFETAAFVGHGNLFWPDFWKKMWLKADFYKKLGQDVPWEINSSFQSAESGQVLIDRLRHVDVLEWLWWLNSHNGITYDNMLGDKDTYRLAFALANKLPEYQQVQLPPRDAMVKLNGSNWMPGISYKHQGMVQHTPDERPAFLHRTDKGKFFPFCYEKIDASACHIDYFTIPLTEGQAQLAMQHGLAYTSHEADVSSYSQKCRKNITKNPNRPDDPRRCYLSEGRNSRPVPLVPVTEFESASIVLEASYVVFEQVRTLVAVGTKVQSMKQDLGQQQQDSQTMVKEGLLTNRAVHISSAAAPDSVKISKSYPSYEAVVGAS